MDEAVRHALTVLWAAYRHEQPPALPPVPEPRAIPDVSDYAGVYRDGNRILQLTAQDGQLLLHTDDGMAPLERRGQDQFYVGHPEFDLFLLEFKRDSGEVVEALHGSHWYISDRYTGPQSFDYPKTWEMYTGHYRTRNPELSNFRVVLRKGTLALIVPSGEVELLHPLDDGVFRIGEDDRSPETLRFDAVVQGRALRADYSGCPYYRTFTG